MALHICDIFDCHYHSLNYLSRTNQEPVHPFHEDVLVTKDKGLSCLTTNLLTKAGVGIIGLVLLNFEQLTEAL